MAKRTTGRPMSAEDFRRAALCVFGSDHGWQTRLAAALGAEKGSVSRWLSGQVPVPGPVRAAMRTWMRTGFDPDDSG